MFKITKKILNFKGRARRSEYWIFVLFYNVLVPLSSLLLIVPFFYVNDPIYTSVAAILGSTLFTLIFIFLTIGQISVTIRRFHDLNLSGWYFFLYIILQMIFIFHRFMLGDSYTILAFAVAILYIIILIIFLVFMLWDGTIGDNKYGPDPKNRTPKSQDNAKKSEIT